METAQVVELRIEKSGQTSIPDELLARLVPGAQLLVKVSDRQPEDNLIRITVQEEPVERSGLVLRDGLLIYEGKVAEGFDWDTFMQEEREAPIHPFEPDAP